ncbi:DUF2326 domain-containing protein [Desulforamulus aquiferis]|uniref:DUF2326 domain-containing protein n=1 Tax=Desulforamulus aquiferis TaxID=1397668 RepID=UPI003570C7DB
MISYTKKITYLKTLKDICNNYGIQYIFTALQDDIPLNSDDTYFGIKSENIAVTLDERDDNTGHLFGFEF